ncbi:MAG: RNA polymerase sigma factor [Actinomycetes bacterium]
MAEPDVAVLVRAAADGDSEAWNALVDRYAGLVWHVARGHRLSEADSADVAQTVWLRLVESLPRLREPKALGGWLATTTRNECLRVIRRAGREIADDSVELSEAPLGDEHSPEAVAELGEQRRLVVQALDRVSDRCRVLLRALAYTPDRSYAEISEALSMPVGSIGPTRGRCLERLRRELVAVGAIAAGEGGL